MWLLMQQVKWYREGIRVLHFAPEEIFWQLFMSLKGIDYWPVDLNPKAYGGRVRKQVDITDITFDDNSFDLIMCTHVLEHIPDDKKAMSELYRVLKPGGIAFLNVPLFNIPATFEDPKINTPELRSKYYGQFDHVRAYGLDYPQRLSNAGFNVQLFTMNGLDEKILKRYGLDRNEKIFLCRKG
ncbi:MAG: methyltransferase domain-containing protein [Selenomonadaceae bacterium]|nr:methyltransferase domain-containing protein [Selenomonadaceae bacterium]